MSVRIIEGDCLATLRTLPDGAAQCCVTSPPYYGLRDYGVEGQIGLEDSPDAYVARLVAVFREVRRVLRDDGTLWLNLGDSYAASQSAARGSPDRSTLTGGGGRYREGSKIANAYDTQAPRKRKSNGDGVKPKDLLGIPWLVAFALRADGWYLRKDIIWHKPNPMPESVRDRPTSAHEHVFLLSKRAAYFYDAEAIAEASEYPGDDRHNRADSRKATEPMCMDGGSRARTGNVTGLTRNARDVWTIATQPYSGAHFATMPPDLAERCIKAGSKPGDTILDPFGGAGTTGLVADRLGRDAILCELNPAYASLARERIDSDAPLIASVA
jgi:DNA modification methylase